MARFPQLVDVVIHIEPPPADDRLADGAFGAKTDIRRPQ